jgi:hypothetical protein
MRWGTWIAIRTVWTTQVSASWAWQAISSAVVESLIKPLR